LLTNLSGFGTALALRQHHIHPNHGKLLRVKRGDGVVVGGGARATSSLNGAIENLFTQLLIAVKVSDKLFIGAQLERLESNAFANFNWQQLMHRNSLMDTGANFGGQVIIPFVLELI